MKAKLLIILLLSLAACKSKQVVTNTEIAKETVKDSTSVIDVKLTDNRLTDIRLADKTVKNEAMEQVVTTIRYSKPDSTGAQYVKEIIESSTKIASDETTDTEQQVVEDSSIDVDVVQAASVNDSIVTDESIKIKSKSKSDKVYLLIGGILLCLIMLYIAFKYYKKHSPW